MNFRKERMEGVLQSELNTLIAREVEISDALLTITDVSIARNLDEAKIYVSVLPKEQEQEVLSALVKKQKELRHLLVKRLNWRLIPELQFVIDTSAEQAASIEKLFIDEERQKN